MRIGVDLGGTKIEAIALGDRDGEVLARRRIPAPRGDYRQTLDALVAIVRDIEREAGVSGTVGIGIPGAISPATGLIKNSNSTWMNGRPLAEELPRLLGRPVRSSRPSQPPRGAVRRAGRGSSARSTTPTRSSAASAGGS